MNNKPVLRGMLVSLALLISCIGAFLVAVKLRYVTSPRIQRWLDGPQNAQRPYGMAPVAWEAYLRACRNAKIHPFRVGQTIGDAPASVGYHKQDGTLKVRGRSIPYTAAVDLDQSDLDGKKTSDFLDALAAQGFAAFYRHGGKWRSREHIHAIYAFLPMKPQLQVQVAEFLRNRRKANKRVKWEPKLRRQREKLRYWML